MTKKQRLSFNNDFEYPIEENSNNISKNSLLTLSKLNLTLKAKSENQKKLIHEISDKEIIICAGGPGTGKTYVSCGMALKLLKSGSFNKIVIIKSVTTLQQEAVGFIKGTLKEKMEPFIYSFIHNFEKLIGKFNVDQLRQQNLIEELPIAYMRGINIDNAIIIVDECQNISIGNIRTILSRLGENSKMILLGDLNQKDIKNKNDSALQFLIDNFKSIEEFGIVELTEDDQIRNKLINKIEDVFKLYDKHNQSYKINTN